MCVCVCVCVCVFTYGYVYVCDLFLFHKINACYICVRTYTVYVHFIIPLIPPSSFSTIPDHLRRQDNQTVLCCKKQPLSESPDYLTYIVEDGGVGRGPGDKGISGKTGEIPLQTNPAYQSREEMKAFHSDKEINASDPHVM